MSESASSSGTCVDVRTLYTRSRSPPACKGATLTWPGRAESGPVGTMRGKEHMTAQSLLCTGERSDDERNRDETSITALYSRGK